MISPPLFPNPLPPIGSFGIRFRSVPTVFSRSLVCWPQLASLLSSSLEYHQLSLFYQLKYRVFSEDREGSEHSFSLIR
jgi:hypothetical protein